MATIGKWHRHPKGGLFRQIHGGNLIGQSITRSKHGWMLTDWPSGHGETETCVERARMIEARRMADKRLMGAV